jgi:hypothetical protein
MEIEVKLQSNKGKTIMFAFFAGLVNLFIIKIFLKKIANNKKLI